MPRDKGEFDLGSYIEVKDRIARFYELYGNGRLVTTDVRLTSEPDGKPRVMVEAAAYRNPDDTLPGRGWSWMELPGNTPYTKGSELENTETSAWGRAIGALGILIDKSIASAQEVRNKEGEAERPEAARPAPVDQEERESLVGSVTRAGTVKAGGAMGYKLEPRQTPDGFAFGFRLEIDRDKAIPQCLVTGQLAADALDTLGGKSEALIGAWARVSGRLYNVTQAGRSSFYRLHVEAIETKEWRLPAEAPSAPMFEAEAVA